MKPNPPDQVLRGDEPANERSGIQVIARAAAIMQLLAQNSGGMSLGQIAKSLALPRSTVQRIVDALNQENLVIAGSSARGVRLGPALIPLATAARFDIAEVARKYMQELASSLGETVDLTIFEQDKVVFIDQITGSHRLQAVSSVGISFPLHASAPGKAVLACLPAAALQKIKKKIRFESHTARTITSWETLEKELEEVRRTGIAVDYEEHDEGICAAAIALQRAGGDLASISIPVPTLRFKEAERDIVNQLLACKEKIERDLLS